jgi:2,5-diketo-D-gluconate reductase B
MTTTGLSTSLQAGLEAQGSVMPRLGLGTSLLYGDEAVEAVRDALEIGYRHLDTARIYENEQSIGWGIQLSGLRREELFLTSKLLPLAQWPWPAKGGSGPSTALSFGLKSFTPDAVLRATEESLARLQTDYLDLLLLHWPSSTVSLVDCLKALSAVLDAGLTRAIGVSNFPPTMLASACELAPIFCNQIEYHPFIDQTELLAIARERRVIITAHTPLGLGRVAGDPTIGSIAVRHGKTPAQVALRWLLDQPGVAAVPKASSHARRLENFQIFDFALSEGDTAAFAELPKTIRLVDPPFAPSWGEKAHAG